MSDTDFSVLIEPVARHFWGDPNKALSSKVELRWGSGGSRSVKLDGEGFWHDFEKNESGGVIKLVMAERKCDKAAAIAWLESEEFIEKREQSRSRAPQRQEDAPPVGDGPPWEESQPAAKSEPLAGIEEEVCHYDYTDRDGQFQYRVIRYQFRIPDGTWRLSAKSGNPDKTFKQKSRDASGKITWGLNGRPPCLFRWPDIEIAISESRAVFIVEGEKDALTLIEWGYAATTNSGGAQGWRDEFTATFAGADVVICADDDEAGQKRVDDIAKALKGTAARVRAIRGWNGCKDVTDWRDKAGGTAEHLQAIIDGLHDYRPRPPRSAFGAQTSGTIATKAVVYDWLLKGLIERNGTLVLAGESMVGKSFKVMDMGMKIAQGLPYGDRKTRQGAVLHMAVEDGKGTELRFKGYLKAHNISPDADIPYVVMDPFANGGTGFSLMSDECVDRFIAEALEWREYYGTLEFIIIDTLAMATEGMDENSSGEASKVLGRVNRIRERTGATVCLVHHMNAGGTKVRGSTAIVANVPNVIEIKMMMTIPQNRREEPRPILDGKGRPIRRVRLAKNKNGVSDKAWSFVLEEVLLNERDDDGDHYSTMFCAPRASNRTAQQEEETTKLIGDQKLVFDALVLAQQDHGMDMPEGAAAPPQMTRCVSQADFVAAVRKVISFKAGEEEIEARNTELQSFLKRTTTALINAGYMGRDNDKRICWWTGKSDRPRPRREVEPDPAPPPSLPADIKADLSEVPF